MPGWLDCDIDAAPDVNLRADVRTPCTFEFLDERLRNAGFAEVARQAFGVTRVPGLASLDNRERESLFVEAVKPFIIWRAVESA